MEVSKELRSDIERNQTKLKIAIRNHQVLVLKLKADPDNVLVKYDLKSAQNDIISIGLDQKELIERLRRELKIHQKNVKANATKTGIEERKCNLTNILSKSRKQTLATRSASVSSASTSEDSLDVPSSPPSPQPPLLPHELTQVDFLGRMGLCTHEVFKELQNKRVERKRRSTANPQFLYGNRWDHTNKRKKNTYLMTLPAPNTRQAVKNKLRAEQLLLQQQQQLLLQQQQQQQQQQQRTSPPLSRSDSRSSSPVSTASAGTGTGKKTGVVPIGLNIPNLPSGLTIERINGNKPASPESKVCLICRTSASPLTVCESCSGSFHVSCHNRPLVQQPRQCPKCLGRKETPGGGGSRDVGSLTVPPSMTVLTTYVSAEVKEKTQEKRALAEHNRTLRTELNQLENRAEHLQTSLQEQRLRQEKITDSQRATEDNIRRLLDFISAIKGPQPPSPSTPGDPSPADVKKPPLKLPPPTTEESSTSSTACTLTTSSASSNMNSTTSSKAESVTVTEGS